MSEQGTEAFRPHYPNLFPHPEVNRIRTGPVAHHIGAIARLAYTKDVVWAAASDLNPPRLRREDLPERLLHVVHAEATWMRQCFEGPLHDRVLLFPDNKLSKQLRDLLDKQSDGDFRALIRSSRQLIRLASHRGVRHPEVTIATKLAVEVASHPDNPIEREMQSVLHSGFGVLLAAYGQHFAGQS